MTLDNKCSILNLGVGEISVDITVSEALSGRCSFVRAAKCVYQGIKQALECTQLVCWPALALH